VPGIVAIPAGENSFTAPSTSTQVAADLQLVAGHVHGPRLQQQRQFVCDVTGQRRQGRIRSGADVGTTEPDRGGAR
jgi:hypothetical protein